MRALEDDTEVITDEGLNLSEIDEKAKAPCPKLWNVLNNLDGFKYR